MAEPTHGRKRTLEEVLAGPPAPRPLKPLLDSPVLPVKAFEVRANDVLRFRLVRRAEDMLTAPLLGLSLRTKCSATMRPSSATAT